MSELIGEFFEREAEAQLARINGQFDELLKKHSTMNGNSIKIEAKVSGVSNIKELKDATSEIIQLQEQQQSMSKQVADTQKKLADAEKNLAEIYDKMNAARNASLKGLTEEEKLTKAVVVQGHKYNLTGDQKNKLLQERRILTNEANKVIREEIKLQDAARNSTERATLLIKKWTLEQSKLNVATAEGARLNDVYNKAIQKADAFRKQYTNTVEAQRLNIGNYKSANIELIQVMREMPAFLNSVQTGLMGISNNLPQLIERIKLTRQEKGSWMAAVKDLAAGIFSFSGIVAILTTALVAFGPKIAEAASNMKLFSSEASRAKKMQKEFSEMTKEAAKSAAEETGKLKTLKSAIEDSNVPMEKRINAVLKLKSEFPQYFEDLKQEDILNGKVGDAYKLAAAGILAKARAQAASAKITSLQNTILENELKLQESRNKYLNDYNNATEEYVTRRGIGGDIITEKRTQEQVRMTLKIQQDARELNWRNAIKAAEEEQEFYINKVNENSEFEVSTAEKTKNKIKDINKDIGPVQLPILGDSDPEKEAQNLANRYRNVFKEFIDKFVQDPENKKAAKEAMDKLLLGGELSEGEARSLKADLMIAVTVNQKDKEKAKKDLEKFLKELEQLANYAREYSTHLSDFKDIALQRELNRIEKEKLAIEDRYTTEELLIRASSLSQEEKEKKAAKLAIQRRAEERKLEREALNAKQRAARFQKSIDMISILASTSIAVMAALGAKPYTPANIATAIGIGAKGAIEFAKVAATPIPQYAKGVKSKPTDGPAIVGEKGVELVKEPGKDPYLTPDTSTLTYLKKGTEVIPHDKLLNYVYQNPKAQRFTSTATEDVQSKKLDTLNYNVEKLTAIMKNKNVSVNLYGDAENFVYKEKNTL